MSDVLSTWNVADLERKARRTLRPVLGLKGKLLKKAGVASLKSLRLRYRFALHYHPFVCLYREAVQRYGLDGLLRPERLHRYTGDPIPGAVPGAIALRNLRQLLAQRAQEEVPRFEHQLEPVAGNVRGPYPVEQIDFTIGGAYSQYNWELFFHLPMLIAGRLAKSGKHAEAREWMHVVFNPTRKGQPDRLEAGGVTTRIGKPMEIGAWRFGPFAMLSAGEPDTEGLSEPDTQAVMVDWFQRLPWDLFPGNAGHATAMERWRENPFDPHAVARVRVPSYMIWTFTQYVKLLISWGDANFRRDTQETIQQAVVLYMEALDLLGRRPIRVEPLHTPPRPRLRDLLEGGAPYPTTDVHKVPTIYFGRRRSVKVGADDAANALVFLTFCLPPNTEILGLWDTIADRLYKIRNSLNLDGVFRQLPLFPPPIDPALLVRAAAAGLDIGSVVASLGAAPPIRRFEDLHRRALDVAREVRGFGQALLSALEKQDGEQLARLRQEQEITLLRAVRSVRKAQADEAKLQIKSAEAARALAEKRRDFYAEQVDERILPEEEASGRNTDIAAGMSIGAQVVGAVGSVMMAMGNQFMPSMGLGWAGQGMASGAQIVEAVAGGFRFAAQKSEREAGFIRRERDWALQRDLAIREIVQHGHSIAAAKVRQTIAEKELENHDLQVGHARDVMRFLESKYAREELYGWLAGELRQLHREALDLATGLARSAQAAYRFETGREDADFLEGSYTTGTYGELVAGDRLLLDLQRMGAGFAEDDRRYLEVSRDIPLSSLSPEALAHLRARGWCAFDLTDAFLDLDAGGTYFRRLKRIEVSVPVTRRPKSNIPMRVTLARSTYQVLPIPPGEDADALGVRSGPRSPVSVLLGHGQRDPGMWASDDPVRYLPFEGEGAAGSWVLELPQGIPAFDYTLIEDVVLHLHFTARDGGSRYRVEREQRGLEVLREGLTDLLSRHVVLSVRTMFPDAWDAFADQGTVDPEPLSFALTAGDIGRLGSALATRPVRSVSVLAVTRGKTPPWSATLAWTEPDDGPGVAEEGPALFLPSARHGFRAATFGFNGDADVVGDWSLSVADADADTWPDVEDLVFLFELGDEP